MVADEIVLPHLWRRYLCSLRALVAAACFWVVLGSRGVSAATALTLAGIITLFSAISVFWRWPERHDALGILHLVLDLLVFLMCVAFGNAQSFWLSAVAGLYLFLSTATQHDWREVLLTTVLTLAFTISVQPPNGEALEPLLLILGMFGCVTSLQKQSLLARLSKVSRVSVYHRAMAARARESERERIAADFHDGPLQNFIGMQMRLDIARKVMERDPAAGRRELEDLREVCARSVTEVRTFVRNMRPIELNGAGLATALRSTAGYFQKDSGIPASFTVSPAAMHDDIEGAVEVVQIVREALHNVHKHSGASRVEVALDRMDKEIEIAVRDDGTGFPFAGSFSLEELEALRMGPESIKRRVRSLNGRLTITSHPGRGSELRIRLPI